MLGRVPRDLHVAQVTADNGDVFWGPGTGDVRDGGGGERLSAPRLGSRPVSLGARGGTFYLYTSPVNLDPGAGFPVTGLVRHLRLIGSRKWVPRVCASLTSPRPRPGPHMTPRAPGTPPAPPHSPTLSWIWSCSRRMTAMDAAGPGMAVTEHRTPMEPSTQRTQHRGNRVPRGLSTPGT